jgi:hypothetical protein
MAVKLAVVATAAVLFYDGMTASITKRGVMAGAIPGA